MRVRAFAICAGLVASAIQCASATANTDDALQIPEPAPQSRRPITIRDLAELRSFTGFSVSPDGRYLAFELWQADPDSNRYRAAWFVAQTTTGGRVLNVGDAGEPQLFEYTNGTTDGEFYPKLAQWSPDSERIAYL